jgi:hypothetical protein
MSELFSPAWMQAYARAWNAEPELADALAQIQFHSTIGYGFKQAADPAGVLVIDNGQVVFAGVYSGQPLSWDLRADLQDWQQWLNNGLDLAGLGLATMRRKLVFEVGDYFSMIKDPRMVRPFIKSFAVMGQVLSSENATA